MRVGTRDDVSEAGFDYMLKGVIEESLGEKHITMLVNGHGGGAAECARTARNEGGRERNEAGQNMRRGEPLRRRASTL
jgi:hypothetical protein